jgi:MFS family permease
MLVSAGVRSTPGVLLVPLEVNFGWSPATVSLTAASGILFYGLTAPFAAALMQVGGIRRTMIGGLALMAASSFASLWMTAPWQFALSWGMLSGVGSGAVASVLGAATVNRWFTARRGLAMGLLGAATSTGSLIFLPVLAWLSREGAWRPVVIAVTLTCATLIPIAAWLVPEHPSDRGCARYGEEPHLFAPAINVGPALADPWKVFKILAVAARRPTFWLLAGTFFVCGITTTGLIGTHMIAYCGDHGISPVAAGGVLSMMGLFDIIGTTFSGWLTDRYDPKKLLAIYYGMRGISLLLLPVIVGTSGLLVFAFFYGLNWIATLPPTVRIANEEFGERDAPLVYGWIQVAHQMGAATAAYGAGLLRGKTGSYDMAFIIAGTTSVIAMALLLMYKQRGIGASAAAA